MTLQTETKISRLDWAAILPVIAIFTAALGFGGIAGTCAGIAHILFFILSLLFVMAPVVRALRGRPPL